MKAIELKEDELYATDGGSWGCWLAIGVTAFGAATFDPVVAGLGGLHMLSLC
jgi:hypothetical protein